MLGLGLRLGLGLGLGLGYEKRREEKRREELWCCHTRPLNQKVHKSVRILSSNSNQFQFVLDDKSDTKNNFNFSV